MDIFQWIHHYATIASRERYRGWIIWKDNSKDYYRRVALYNKLQATMIYARWERRLWKEYLEDLEVDTSSNTK